MPKVFIECANMRNATDAALVTTPAWQAKAAAAIAAGLTGFLTQPLELESGHDPGAVRHRLRRAPGPDVGR